MITVVSEDRGDMVFPWRQSVQLLQSINIWTFRGWKWRSLKLIWTLCWFSCFWPCSCYLVYGFCPRLLFCCMLSDTNWKWQSQSYLCAPCPFYQVMLGKRLFYLLYSINSITNKKKCLALFLLSFRILDEIF